MKAKKILLCAVSLVLLLLIVVRIVHVNTNVLTIPEERYAQNQWVELNGAFQEMDDENTAGYSVRILGAEQLTYNEFLEKYGASENPPEGKDDIETVLDVEYEFRNVGNSDGYLLLIQYMIAHIASSHIKKRAPPRQFGRSPFSFCLFIKQITT